MRKRIVSLGLASLLTVTLAACAGGSDPAPSGSAAGDPVGFGDCEPTGEPGSIQLDTIVEGQLSTVTALPNPGWYNGTSPENLTDGFEFCMVVEIAHRAGLNKLDVTNLSWDQYISGSFTDYDLGATVTGITEERKKVFNFSAPYYSSNIAVTLPVDSEYDESNIRDAKIGTIQSSTNATWLLEVLKPTQELALFSDGPEMFAALAANQVDAIVTDTETALTQSKPFAGKVEVVGQYAADAPWGMILPLDSPNVEQVSKAVEDMRADGTFDRLSKLYLEPLFGIDPASVPFWTVQ